jgi:hypothetical protein
MSTKPNPSSRQHDQQLATVPNRDEIQERAYYRYVERGRADGNALDDWLTAETEMRRKTSPPADS